MDELDEFCARVLGNGTAAEHAASQARGAGTHDRVNALVAAAAACRAHDEPDQPAPRGDGGAAAGRGLADAVAHELAAATARLPERQREALALRELLDLPHGQIARVMAIEAPAVAPLLARARLCLRMELRGGAAEPTVQCAERDRALRVLALRQDGYALDEAETTWLLEHLGRCQVCTQAHAAMLEASVCYRAWKNPGSPDPSASDAGDRGAVSA